MKRYFAIKGARFIFCLAIVIILQFLIPRLMPGSPVNNLTGPDSIGLSEKQYQELEHELGLDLPLTRQLADHISNIANLNLGFSWFYHQPVMRVITQYLGPTVQIVLPSVVLSAFIAMFFGSLAGRHPGKITDFLFTPAFVLLYAVPAFLTAMVALTLFGFTWNIFSLSGLGGIETESGTFTNWIDIIRHMTLPVTVLAVSTAGPKYLLMRNRVEEESAREYVIFARSRGIGETRILFVHIIRNACLPVINLIGLDFGFILSGSLLIEIVFSINGMGSLLYEAAMNRDYPILQGCFLLLSLSVLAVNFLVDVISGLLDPGASV